MKYTRILFFNLIALFFYLFSSCSSSVLMHEEIESIIKVDTIKFIDNSLHINDTLDLTSHNELMDVKFNVLFPLTSESSSQLQGFAIYNGLLFQCHHSIDVIDVIDIERKKIVSSIKMQPDELIHCNNVNFGSEFFDQRDDFPLLYIQQRGFTNQLNVYRIIRDSESVFSMQLVQIISFTYCDSSVTSINRFDNRLYVIYSLKKKKYIATFNLPSLNEGNVVLDMRNAVKTSYLLCEKVIQDTACNENCLFFLSGYGGEGELWQIDLDKNEVIVIDLLQCGLKGEPEGLDFYADNIYLTMMRKLYIKQ